MKTTEKIYDVITGETTFSERDMTKEELFAYNKFQQELKEQKAKMADVAASKLVLLEKLGITEDEAKLLLS
jgi:hypothetical protein